MLQRDSLLGQLPKAVGINLVSDERSRPPLPAKEFDAGNFLIAQVVDGYPPAESCVASNVPALSQVGTTEQGHRRGLYRFVLRPR